MHMRLAVMNAKNNDKKNKLVDGIVLTVKQAVSFRVVKATTLYVFFFMVQQVLQSPLKLDREKSTSATLRNRIDLFSYVSHCLNFFFFLRHSLPAAQTSMLASNGRALRKAW